MAPLRWPPRHRPAPSVCSVGTWSTTTSTSCSVAPALGVLAVEPVVVGGNEVVPLDDAQRPLAARQAAASGGRRSLSVVRNRQRSPTDRAPAPARAARRRNSRRLVHQIFPCSRHLSKIGLHLGLGGATASSAFISPLAAAANIWGTRNWLTTSSTAALVWPGWPRLVDQLVASARRPYLSGGWRWASPASRVGEVAATAPGEGGQVEELGSDEGLPVAEGEVDEELLGQLLVLGELPDHVAAHHRMGARAGRRHRPDGARAIWPPVRGPASRRPGGPRWRSGSRSRGRRRGAGCWRHRPRRRPRRSSRPGRWRRPSSPPRRWPGVLMVEVAGLVLDRRPVGVHEGSRPGGNVDVGRDIPMPSGMTQGLERGPRPRARRPRCRAAARLHLVPQVDPVVGRVGRPVVGEGEVFSGLRVEGRCARRAASSCPAWPRPLRRSPGGR